MYDMAQFASQPVLKTVGMLQNGLSQFTTEDSWYASKRAVPIHDHGKIMAHFKTGWVDSFETNLDGH